MASDEAQKPMQRLNLREARSILVSCLVCDSSICIAREMVVMCRPSEVTGSCWCRHAGWNN